jgi:hypothetical protein
LIRTNGVRPIDWELSEYQAGMADFLWNTGFTLGKKNDLTYCDGS